MLRPAIVWRLVGIALAFGAIQAVPYGREHTNPPVRLKPAWDSQRTRDLAVIACFDCHSNQTRWTWYTNVAPVSWVIQRDVDEGRGKINFSEWDRPQKEPHEAAKTVREGEMPPWSYTWLHPEVRLSSAETQGFVQGLIATFGQGERGRRSR